MYSVVSSILFTHTHTHTISLSLSLSLSLTHSLSLATQCIADDCEFDVGRRIEQRDECVAQRRDADGIVVAAGNRVRRLD